jgi:phosphoglycerate dehydrogenase-like enzyme
MARVLLYEKVPQAWFDGFAGFLRERQPAGLPVELVQPESDELDAMLSLVPEADVLVVGLTGQRRAVVRNVLEKATRLRLVQKLGSRAHGVDLAAARELRVAVSLLAVPAHVACAEHTLLLMLAAIKRLPAAHRCVVEQAARKSRAGSAAPYAYNWADFGNIGTLAGKVLGLIGMADIGVEVAVRAKAFGMRVVYYQDEALPQDEEAALGVAFRPLDDLLREADVVSLHAALTPRTERLLNAERLGLMKPSAILVNAARGGVVDEEALADALLEGKLAGAAIDAWATEPPPKSNPLLRLENIVGTPHIAAGTFPPTSIFEALLPNVLAALRGEPMSNLLTPAPEPPPPSLEQPPKVEEQPPAEPPCPEAPPAEEQAVVEQPTAGAEPVSEEEPPTDAAPPAEQPASEEAPPSQEEPPKDQPPGEGQ